MIGGYTRGGSTFDALIFGYYDGDDLIYAARTRNGFTPAVRAQLFKRFKALFTGECPFVNLPEARSDRWGQGPHQGEDGRAPVAHAGARRPGRARRVDRRQSSPAFEIRRPPRRQGREGRGARVTAAAAASLFASRFTWDMQPIDAPRGRNEFRHSERAAEWRSAPHTGRWRGETSAGRYSPSNRFRLAVPP